MTNNLPSGFENPVVQLAVLNPKLDYILQDLLHLTLVFALKYAYSSSIISSKNRICAISFITPYEMFYNPIQWHGTTSHHLQ